MDRRGSPGNDMNAARSLDRTMAGLDTLNSREPSCVLADMQKQLLQLEQQNKRVLLEQQNKRVLLKARVEEDEASKTSSAEIPALPIDRPHASQEHRLGLLMRDPQNKRRLELARAQTMGAFGQSSNEIPARYDNNNIHAGAQKRKRSTNGEGILPRPHNTSSDTASGWPNSHNVVNLIQDRVQAVSTGPASDFLSCRILVNMNSRYHLLISVIRSRSLLRLWSKQYPQKQQDHLQMYLRMCGNCISKSKAWLACPEASFQRASMYDFCYTHSFPSLTSTPGPNQARCRYRSR